MCLGEVILVFSWVQDEEEGKKIMKGEGEKERSATMKEKRGNFLFFECMVT